MERVREKGIKFNVDKLQLKCDEVSFFGYIWIFEGVKLDNKKVLVIFVMKFFDNVKDLQSFFGLVNYLIWYLSQLVIFIVFFCELIKKEIVFVWGLEYDIVF